MSAEFSALPENGPSERPNLSEFNGLRDSVTTWPDGQVRPEAPYRCGAFVTGTGQQCTKLSDHDGPHSFEERALPGEPQP